MTTGEPGGDPIPTTADVLAGYITNTLANPNANYLDPRADLVVTVAIRDQLGMEESLAAGMLTERNAVHASGLAGFDGATIQRINEAKTESATRFAKSYMLLTDPVRYHRLQYADDPEAALRASLQGPDWDSLTVAEWVDGIEANRGNGIVDAPALMGLVTLARFNYAPELGLDHPYRPHRDDMRQALSLYSAGQLREGVSTAEVCLRMRQAGVVDASQERLDARLENLLSVMQFQTGVVLVQTLDDVWSAAGAMREPALRFFDKHRELFLRDDFAATEAMAASAVTLLEGLAAAGRVSGRALQFIEAKTNYLSKFLEDCKGVHRSFVTIYEGLGYDMPEELRPAAPVESETDDEGMADQTVVGEAAGSLVVGATVEDEPEPDPEVVERLQGRAVELAERTDRANQPWKMKKAAIEKAGLSRAAGMLTRPDGLYNVANQFLLPRMDRHQAEQLVAVIRQLSLMGAREPAVAQRQLESIWLLGAQIDGLRTEIRNTAPGQAIELPSLIASTHIDGMLANWRLYEQIILTIWPQGEARQIANRIHDLLLPTAG